MSIEKDLPLRCRVVGNKLIFEIGIDTLAWAAERCPAMYDDDKHRGSTTYCKVVDAHELARDVCRMMNHEEEDGSSPLTELLDSAILAALEDGSAGFADE